MEKIQQDQLFGFKENKKEKKMEMEMEMEIFL